MQTQPSANTPTTQEEEVTLKDLILKLQDWLKYFLKKWKLILLCGIVGAGLGLAYAYSKKPDYIAELTFVLEDSKSNPMGAYAGLASQFGIDLGGSASSGLFSADNILEFLRSRLMVEKTLLSPITVNNKQISMADYYIDFQKMRKGWEGKEKLEDLHFPINPNRQQFSLQQDSILNILYLAMVKTHMSIGKVDKKLSFIALSCRTPDEKFSKAFAERLVLEATDFYVNTKTKRSKVNVDILQRKADSISFLLNRKTYSAAVSQDFNLNPVKRVATVNTELMNLDKTVLQTMYGEVLKNLEMSKFSMSQETPLIQLVDMPILPLKKEKFGRLKGLIIGGLLGGIFILGFLGIKRLYKEIMN